MMIENIELGILILVLNGLDFDSKVTGVQENKNFCASYLTKFITNLDVIWCAVETFWSDECHIHFILSKGQNVCDFFSVNPPPPHPPLPFPTFNISLRSDIFSLISFKLGMMMETIKLYILIPV